MTPRDEVCLSVGNEESNEEFQPSLRDPLLNLIQVISPAPEIVIQQSDLDFTPASSLVRKSDAECFAVMLNHISNTGT